MTTSKAGELIRAKLAQKELMKYFQEFEGLKLLEIKDSKLLPEINQPLSQFLKIGSTPKDKISKGASLSDLKVWFDKCFKSAKDANSFMLSTGKFSCPYWALIEIELEDKVELLRLLWNDSEHSDFYWYDNTNKVLNVLFDEEHQYEFHRAEL